MSATIPGEFFSPRRCWVKCPRTLVRKLTSDALDTKQEIPRRYVSSTARVKYLWKQLVNNGIEFKMAEGSIETWSRTIFNQRTTGSLKQLTALVHGLDLHREKHPLSAAATEDDEARF
jgi:hypothetical protein